MRRRDAARCGRGGPQPDDVLRRDPSETLLLHERRRVLRDARVRQGRRSTVDEFTPRAPTRLAPDFGSARGTNPHPRDAAGGRARSKRARAGATPARLPHTHDTTFLRSLSSPQRRRWPPLPRVRSAGIFSTTHCCAACPHHRSTHLYRLRVGTDAVYAAFTLASTPRRTTSTSSSTWRASRSSASRSSALASRRTPRRPTLPTSSAARCR